MNKIIRYRKKPVIIEAFQMTKERRQDNSEWPNWLNEAWQKDFHEVGSVGPGEYPNSNGTDRITIKTLEGDHWVSWGDYIIQGVAGELYPCKPDIFEKTYEEVADYEIMYDPCASSKNAIKLVKVDDNPKGTKA